MKTKSCLNVFIFCLLLLGFSQYSYGLEKRDISAKTKGLVVYHFDEPDIQKKLNVDFGSWELHPSYITDATVVRSQDEKEAEEFGNVLRISYDVSMSQEDLPYANYPTFNGVWFHLGDVDLSEYDTLVFYARGDGDAGFTSRFKVELKNNKGEIGKYYVNDIGFSWRRLEIPMNMFKTDVGKSLKSFKSLKELTIVFEKEQVTKKKGVIFVDNIYFSGPKDVFKKPEVETAKPAALKK